MSPSCAPDRAMSPAIGASNQDLSRQGPPACGPSGSAPRRTGLLPDPAVRASPPASENSVWTRKWTKGRLTAVFDRKPGVQGSAARRGQIGLNYYGLPIYNVNQTH